MSTINDHWAPLGLVTFSDAPGRPFNPDHVRIHAVRDIAIAIVVSSSELPVRAGPKVHRVLGGAVHDRRTRDLGAGGPGRTAVVGVVTSPDGLPLVNIPRVATVVVHRLASAPIPPGSRSPPAGRRSTTSCSPRAVNLASVVVRASPRRPRRSGGAGGRAERANIVPRSRATNPLAPNSTRRKPRVASRYLARA